MLRGMRRLRYPHNTLRDLIAVGPHGTIAATARASGVSRRALTACLAGRPIAHRTAVRLAIALRVGVDDLARVVTVLDPLPGERAGQYVGLIAALEGEAS